MEANMPEWVYKVYTENKNNLVITADMKVCRLIGLAQDYIDYLYVLYDGDAVLLHGVMLGIIKLKGALPEADYVFLDRQIDKPDLSFGLHGTTRLIYSDHKLEIQN